MERSELPVGFAMALAMNPEAMQRFSALSEDEKRQVIEGTHGVAGKDEMHRYVNQLTAKKDDAAGKGYTV